MTGPAGTAGPAPPAGPAAPAAPRISAPASPPPSAPLPAWPGIAPRAPRRCGGAWAPVSAPAVSGPPGRRPSAATVPGAEVRSWSMTDTVPIPGHRTRPRHDRLWINPAWGHPCPSNGLTRTLGRTATARKNIGMISASSQPGGAECGHAHPRGGRRPGGPGLAAPLAGLQRLRGRARGRRAGGAGGDREAAAGRRRARRHDAPARRPGDLPAAALGRRGPPGPAAHRARRGPGPGRRPGRRRRRLPPQAVRAGGAAGPAARAAAPHPGQPGRRRRTPRWPSPTSRWTRPPAR